MSRDLFIQALVVCLLLLLVPIWARTQVVVAQNCNEEQSWIARWTVTSIKAPGATGPVNVVNLVGEGDRATYYQPPTGSPWTFDIDFGIIRHFTGVKIYTPNDQFSPGSYELFLRADSLAPWTSVRKGILTPAAGSDVSIDFDGAYYNAINVRIVFYDAWATPLAHLTTAPLRIYELNFFQCGVDPLIAKQIPQSAVPTPALSCADEISGSIFGVINTYCPGLADAPAGSKSVKIDLLSVQGASHSLAAGDRVLLIQMQNADISETNSMAYGDGIDHDLIGSGWTNVNNTGEYEFGIVESISGNTVQLTQPLQKSYFALKAFQVVYSPAYDNVTLGGTVTAYPWDGHCGGIVTFDAKKLNLNNQQIQVSAQGFRGGKMNSNGVQPSPEYFWDTYCTDNSLLFGEKGEGIAGSPSGTYSLARRLYAPHTGNTGGSYARGAPGNAGGGGNDHNSGGGGGGNIGSGGQGGASWGSTSSSDMTQYWTNIIPNGYVRIGNDHGFVPNGGMGGTGCGEPDPFRVWMGGGGGGGHQNDNAATGGGNGGGIILVTAMTVVGNGSFMANGENAAKTIFCPTCTPSTKGNDGAGGGGGGGTIVFGFNDQSAANIIYSATGGNGGDNMATDAPHGPGGGGGGGAIVLSALPSTPSNVNVTGGVGGVYVKTGGLWGANKGQAGKVTTSNKLQALYTYTCDHGDAPLSYGDAAHQLKPDKASLRTPGDAESMAQNQPPHDKDAKGDDLTGINDEDGVQQPFDTTLSTAQSIYKVKINVSNPKKDTVFVCGWIDFNGNGQFDDKEKTVLSGVIVGDTVLIWKSFPSDITGGDTYARFRISTGKEALKSIGVAPDGEDEDYTIHINGIPSARPDDTCTHANRPVNIMVVANDNIQGDKRGKITILTPPVNGLATINQNGTPDDKSDDFITYKPKAGFQGVDTLTYELWNSIGNSAKAKVTITVKEPVAIGFAPNPSEGCSPQTVKFTNRSSDLTARFSWDFGDGSPISHQVNPVHTYQTVDTTARFTVKLMMNTGCGILRDSLSVTVHPVPTAILELSSNEERPEYVVYKDISKGSVSRVWQLADGTTQRDAQITVRYDSTGNHPVKLTVFDQFGCSNDTTVIHKTVFRGLYVPNAFIPGSPDPLVNTFKPVGYGLKEYTVMVFDLWGNLIWSSTKLNADGQPVEGWDGKDKTGKSLPTDAYIWRAKAVLIGGKQWKGMEIHGSYHTEGSLTIIR